MLGWWCGGGVVADTNYLYPARWGWINIISDAAVAAFIFASAISSVDNSNTKEVYAVLGIIF